MNTCPHCGQPVPTEAAFCCHGCAAAYDLVRGLGLERYYQRRAVDPAARPLRPDDEMQDIDYSVHVQPGPQPGTAQLYLMIDGLQCAACVWLIESVLAQQPGVVQGRLNMTTRRLTLVWRTAETDGNRLVAVLSRLGYRAVPFNPAQLNSAQQRDETELLRSMAVAGFSAGNVMLLSVAVWSGHSEGMGPATRDLMHWLSALVTLPAIAYAARPFVRSALAVLRQGRTNMDVPISLGVTLATLMSLVETFRSGPHAYFDSAIMLLFFLLVGRYLDVRARGRARASAEHLLALRATAVTVLDADGHGTVLPPERVRRGDTVLVAVGERVPVDGRISNGSSDLDTSLITGETLPRVVTPGDTVFAGMLNMTAPLRLTVTAVGEGTLLAEIVRLMEVAEQGRARHVALADRVARYYAPVVHITALATFLAWVLLGDMAWQPALLIAIAVLIITCPCALALAVPVVQVVASGRLLRQGILLKSATALERLAEVDTILFDKTGTLTEGRPTLCVGESGTAADRALAASLAGASRHPLARALVAAVPGVAVAEGVQEIPGAGLLWNGPGGAVRLGSRRFVGITETVVGTEKETGRETGTGTGGGPELWLAQSGQTPVCFRFQDSVRADAAATVAKLRLSGYRLLLLSGDRAPVVQAVAQELGIREWQAECAPADKVSRLESLRAAGQRVLMVGDGLNDAPALAAATVSMSPSTAVDVSQTTADVVFQGRHLAPVADALAIARRADRLVRQNFALAFLYNLFTVPLAMAGFVTPLIAALAMSSSSVVVIANALRLARHGSLTYGRATLPDSHRPQPWSARAGGVPVGPEIRPV